MQGAEGGVVAGDSTETGGHAVSGTAEQCDPPVPEPDEIFDGLAGGCLVVDPDGVQIVRLAAVAIGMPLEAK